MDIARDKSKFWHRISSDCGSAHTDILYDIMKKARSRHHYTCMLKSWRSENHTPHYYWLNQSK